MDICSIFHSFSISAKLKFSDFANSSILFHSISFKNSQSEFSNLRAFRCSGLWLAVMIIHHCAFSWTTAISVVGVVANHIWITEIHIPISVDTTKFSTISQDKRASFHTTILISESKFF